MNLSQNYYKFAKLPIRVKFSKLGAKLYALIKSTFSKKTIYKNSTYSHENHSLSKIVAFEFNTSSISENVKSRIVSRADCFIRREMLVLSASPLNISYHSTAKEFENDDFGSKDSFTSLNNFINRHINKSNRETALVAASKINDAYIPINWQRDFRSGYEWDISKIGKQLGLGGEGVDIKVPWELGRMHQCLDLAMSYGISNDKKYLSEFINCFYDFYAANPPTYGVQWKSPMDVAIRAVNLLVAYDIFRSCGIQFSQKFRSDFAASIFDHGSFIRRNLEWSGGMRGNHFLANLTGLAFCGHYLIESDETREWMHYTTQKLPLELEYQFLSDGGNFEDSTAYHFLAVELLLLPIILANVKGKSLALSALSQDKLLRILDFSKSNLDRLFTDQRFGDDDSGYLLKLNYSNRPHSKHYQLGLIDLLNQKEITRIDLSKLINLPDKQNKNTPHSEIFKDFGIALFKNASYDFFLKCSKPGQNGKGGHSHNDMTSFTLNFKGSPVIVDPGTYVYTGSEYQRNLYRSIGAHNAVQINRYEPNTWKTNSLDDLFWINREIKEASLKIDSDSILFAEYSFLTYKISRNVELFDRKIEITDRITGSGNKIFRLHFSPEVECQIIDDNTLKIMINRSAIMIICPFEIVIKDYKYSPSYGVQVNAKMIESITNMNEFTTRIELI